jgi:hypothetical protein
MHSLWQQRQHRRRSWTLVGLLALGLLGLVALGWAHETGALAVTAWSDRALKPLYEDFARPSALTLGLCPRAPAVPAICAQGVHATWTAPGTHVRVLVWLQLRGNHQPHAVALRVGHAFGPGTCRLGAQALVSQTARISVLDSTWSTLTPFSVSAPRPSVPWSRYCFTAYLDGQRQDTHFLTVWWRKPASQSAAMLP